MSGALTFTTANWDTAQTVTVSTAQDLDAIDDAAVIGNTVSGGDYGAVAAASVDVTVDDDEPVSTGVILTVSPKRVSEGASATTVTVTARLNGGTRGDATPVAVTVGSGTATSGTDFAAVAGFTISIPANTQSHTGHLHADADAGHGGRAGRDGDGERHDDGVGLHGDGARRWRSRTTTPSRR